MIVPQLLLVKSVYLLLKTAAAKDKKIACEEEFSDSEDEGTGGRKHRENNKPRKRLRIDPSSEKKDKKGKISINYAILCLSHIQLQVMCQRQIKCFNEFEQFCLFYHPILL